MAVADKQAASQAATPRRAEVSDKSGVPELSKEQELAAYRDMLLKKPYADPSAMKILLDVIAESNPKAKNVNLGSLINSSFVERLDREGFFGK